jgi:4-hydroxy-tetrahydrodipicolinate synthase
VVPPLISPLNADGTIDKGGLGALIEHLVENGCTGLFMSGGCGEGPWLTNSQRADLIATAVATAHGRVPVLAGVMLPGTAPAIDAARKVADGGADSLIVTSPYYFGANAAAQQRHVEGVLAAVDLPVLLYNIPQCTHAPMSPATVANLAAEKRVIGIKDSAGDFQAFLGMIAVKRIRPDFRVLQGVEHLAAASLLHGGDGLVPGLANVAPALFVAVRRAAAAGDAAECARLHERILELADIYGHTDHFLSALKGACAVIGIGNGLPAAPGIPATDAQRGKIAADLKRLGVTRGARVV